MLSGEIPGRGRKTAFMKVWKSDPGRQTVSLYDGSVAMIPGYVKSERAASKKNFVARLAEPISGFLFSVFELLAIPYQRALQVLDPKTLVPILQKNLLQDSHHYKKDFLIDSRVAKMSGVTTVSEMWRKSGLQTTVPQYRQWCSGFVNDPVGSHTNLSKMTENGFADSFGEDDTKLHISCKDLLHRSAIP